MKAFQGGTVHVANEVIDIIIALTAVRVDNVVAVKGYDDVKNRLHRNYKSHIKTVVDDRYLTTDLTILVDMQRPIIEIVEEVQDKIRQQVESMLGLQCGEVNITVAG